MAVRLGARAGGRDRRLQRAAEPLDVERLLDLPEGRRWPRSRTAGIRHPHAGRVPRPARPLHAWLIEDPRIRCIKPAGAFYLFVNISALLSPDGIRTSAEFATRLLDESHVALTAGEAFDAPGFLRISYATSMDRLREGATRILDFVKKLDAAVQTTPAGTGQTAPAATRV